MGHCSLLQSYRVIPVDFTCKLKYPIPLLFQRLHNHIEKRNLISCILEYNVWEATPEKFLYSTQLL